MADTKISALTGATTPLAGTEVLPIVQGAVTKKVAVSDLTAGRQVSAGYLNIKQLNEYPANPAGVSYVRQSSAAAWQTYIAADGNFSFYSSVLGDRAFYMTTAGNLAVNTAGKGIDFTANGGDVLTQYDEGTWTPTRGAGLAVVGTFSSTGKYTRVGRQVTVSGTLSGSTSIAVAPATILCGALPFTPSGNYVGGLAVSNLNQFAGVVTAGSNLYSTGSTTADTQILFTVTFDI